MSLVRKNIDAVKGLIKTIKYYFDQPIHIQLILAPAFCAIPIVIVPAILVATFYVLTKWVIKNIEQATV